MSASEKILDWMREGDRIKKERAEFQEFWDYLEQPASPGIVIEGTPSVLTEATQATVGQFTAFRHQPHFQGDEYHGHCDVGGGHHVAWRVTGPKHHPNKFPAHVPRDAKAAVARVLNVDVSKLEEHFIILDNKKTLVFLMG
jgi:hypothetical protein